MFFQQKLCLLDKFHRSDCSQSLKTYLILARFRLKIAFELIQNIAGNDTSWLSFKNKNTLASREILRSMGARLKRRYSGKEYKLQGTFLILM